jgi:hypothetical protein
LFAMVLMVVKQTFELDKLRVDEVKVNGASKIPDNK